MLLQVVSYHMKEVSLPCNAAMVGILVRLLKVIITITMRRHKVSDNDISSVSTSPVALIFTPIKQTSVITLQVNCIQGQASSPITYRAHEVLLSLSRCYGLCPLLRALSVSHYILHGRILTVLEISTYLLANTQVNTINQSLAHMASTIFIFGTFFSALILIALQFIFYFGKNIQNLTSAFFSLFLSFEAPSSANELICQ